MTKTIVDIPAGAEEWRTFCGTDAPTVEPPPAKTPSRTEPDTPHREPITPAREPDPADAPCGAPDHSSCPMP